MTNLILVNIIKDLVKVNIKYLGSSLVLNGNDDSVARMKAAEEALGTKRKGHLPEKNRWMNESITALVIMAAASDQARP
ncbi:hypothetical protein L1987_78900 [Smallanthus sonchifolius]|uniref:Uncharacterized protein n=1 Tax=Smallanthus sonchifolius TaxID=185202 RepID=A0ACB8ZEJ2_9ASTR|nr:hypothetical protein L1987_78900 [Smallanthus sonchifolius]